MSDFLDAGRHFASPKFWLFEAEGEFFNTHRRQHSEPHFRDQRPFLTLDT